jgi:hypothetical protein
MSLTAQGLLLNQRFSYPSPSGIPLADNAGDFKQLDRGVRCPKIETGLWVKRMVDSGINRTFFLLVLQLISELQNGYDT